MVLFNSRGQVLFYTFMIAVVVLVLALAFAPTLKTFTDNARNASTDTQVGLDCSNSSISDSAKASCTVTDLSLPYFIIGMLGLVGIIIGARVVFGGNG